MDLMIILVCGVLLSSYPGFCTSNTDVQYFRTYTGVSITLPCRASNDENVDWSFESINGSPAEHLYLDGSFANGHGQHFEVDKSQIRQHNLAILKPDRNHIGLYKCIEKAGIGDEHRVYLNVTDIPTHAAFAGQRVQLPCRRLLTKTQVSWIVEDPPSPDIRRICMDGRIDPAFSTRFNLDRVKADEGNLIISSAQVQDSGTYTCTENAGTDTRHPVHLVVAESQGHVIARKGSKVTFGCAVYNESPVLWRFQQSGSTTSTPLYNGLNMSDQRISVISSNDHRMQVLEITSVQPSDAGKYTCGHENDVPNSQSYELVIAGSELRCNISAGSCTDRSARNFTIQCDLNYSGNLHPTVVCSHGHITNIVLRQHDDMFTNSIPLSDDVGTLSCQCKSEFNANYKPATPMDVLTWKTSNVLEGAGCIFGITTGDEVTLAVIFGILFGISLLAIALMSVLFYKKWRRNSKSQPLPMEKEVFLATKPDRCGDTDENNMSGTSANDYVECRRNSKSQSPPKEEEMKMAKTASTYTPDDINGNNSSETNNDGRGGNEGNKNALQKSRPGGKLPPTPDQTAQPEESGTSS